MFADRMELVAAVAATAWLVLAATAVVARRRAVPRCFVRADVVVAGGVATLLFGAGAALADHIADGGKGPTGYDSAVWTFAVEHRATAGTVVASALRAGGGIVALGALACAVGTAAGAARAAAGRTAGGRHAAREHAARRHA